LADSGKGLRKAALNQDWNKAEKGWVEIQMGNEPAQKLEVTETGANTGIFTAQYIVPKTGQRSKLTVSYGYLGFEKKAELTIAR